MMAKRYDMTPLCWEILRALEDEGDMSVRGIERIIGREKGDLEVRQTMQFLKERGMIRRASKGSDCLTIWASVMDIRDIKTDKGRSDMP